MRCTLITFVLAILIHVAGAQKLTVFEVKNKKGFADELGNIKVPAKYDLANRFENGYAVVGIYNEDVQLRYGMIDTSGKEVIPLKYAHLAERFSEALMAAELNNKWGFIDAKNQTIIPFTYDYAYNFSEGLAAVRLNNKIGFITTAHKLKIPFMYDEVKKFKEARCAVKLYNKWGFINEDGAQVVPFKYSDVSYSGFCGGLTGVEQFDKMAVINASGKELTAFKYKDVESSYFNTTLNIIKVGSIGASGEWVYGVVDNKGNEIIPLQYSEIKIYDYNVIVAELNGKEGILNYKNKLMLPFEYSGIYMSKDESPNGTIYKLGKGDNAMVFSLNNDKIDIWKYEQVQKESEGLRAAVYKTKWGFFDATGAEAVTFKYDTVTGFLGGYAFVKLNKKVGYVNKSGKEIIPVKYDGIYTFADNMAAVTADGKWGFINDKFQETVPLQYESVRDFSNGYATVQLNKKSGVVNRLGQVIVPIKYDDVDAYSDGMFAVILNNKIGFADATGKEIIACTYDKMERKFYNGKAKVVKDGKTFTIDKAGKVL